MQCEWRHHLLQAHLVTQGFTQATSLNYNVTFAPMENFVSNHMVLALIAHNDWEVHQVDVKNVYLNARLTKMIYMRQLLSFTPWEQGAGVLAIQSLVSPQTGQALLVPPKICKAFTKFLYT